jgi:hypothetical protein
MICSPHSHDVGDHIKKNEMGGTCGTYGGHKEVYR